MSHFLRWLAAFFLTVALLVCWLLAVLLGTPARWALRGAEWARDARKALTRATSSPTRPSQ